MEAYGWRFEIEDEIERWIRSLPGDSVDELQFSRYVCFSRSEILMRGKATALSHSIITGSKKFNAKPVPRGLLQHIKYCIGRHPVIEVRLDITEEDSLKGKTIWKIVWEVV